MRVWVGPCMIPVKKGPATPRLLQGLSGSLSAKRICRPARASPANALCGEAPGMENAFDPVRYIKYIGKMGRFQPIHAVGGIFSQIARCYCYGGRRQKNDISPLPAGGKIVYTIIMDRTRICAKTQKCREERRIVTICSPKILMEAEKWRKYIKWFFRLTG